MCGFIGLYDYKNHAADYAESIRKAANKIQNRGPDHTGFYTDNHISLAHTRLAVIDTSSAGNQPMTDDHNSLVIVYNGEVYNYQTLKDDLKQKGHLFKTETDTEVLLKLYAEYGDKMPSMLYGCFAFAIYDKKNKSVFLVRDRYGIKPLWFFASNDTFIFGSELKAMEILNIPALIDHVSLFQYLQLNYIVAPHSVYRNVKKIEPGTYLKIEGKNIKKSHYYKLGQKGNFDSKKHIQTYEQAKKALFSCLETSVRRRLITDVPLGSFLSGGIDSTVVAALASKHTDHLQTFSIGFRDEPFFDETSYAEAASREIGTNHHTFQLTNDDLFTELFNMLDALDEPFADSSALAVYILSKKTRKHVTVALSGDGADEIFAGYNKHMAEWAIRNKQGFNIMIKTLHPFFKRLPQSRNSSVGNLIRQMNRYAEGLRLTHSERYWRWCGYANENDAEKLAKHGFDKLEYAKRKNSVIAEIQSDGSINNVLTADTKMLLQNDMLIKADLMSMAHSLEVRVPFLDHDVVDLAFSLPAKFKIDKNQNKRILKDTFSQILPKATLQRKKHGFEVPLLKWFRNELSGLIKDDLLGKSFIKKQDLFRETEIESIKNRLFSSNPGDSVARIWGLIVFQHWWKKHFY